jgi:hypothetical protein
LAVTSWAKKLMPVALPPGRARLATSPNLTGVFGAAGSWRASVAVARFAGHVRQRGSDQLAYATSIPQRGLLSRPSLQLHLKTERLAEASRPVTTQTLLTALLLLQEPQETSKR